jgi:prepilin-type N-terminal cleavage/methylation domain-containing protein
MSMNKNNYGFSLVEVMVALLIVSAGVVGVVSLQSNILKSEKSGDLRQIAMGLGNAKLDDLHSFIGIEDKMGQFDYNEIADNTGGALAAGNIQAAISTKAGDVHSFNRQWVVTDQYYVDTDGDGSKDTWVNAASADAPSPLPATASQKLVSVVVAWTDIDGATKQINIQGSLAPVAFSRSFQAINETDNAKSQPKVNYISGAAPDVISYELGNGEKVETSKPQPDIRNNGENTVVKFETVRYIRNDEGNDKLEQEDFVTLNCACTLAGQGQGKTPAMSLLRGGALTTELGNYVNKMTGVPANNKQEPLCTSCCRDHHDTQDMVANEIQFREESGSPHKHYKANTNNTFTLASSSGDQYNEICRFKRVDGLFEIYPDWELLDIIEFSDQYLLEGAQLDNYVDYSESLVIARIKGTSAPAKPVDRDRVVGPGGYQYVARGVYMGRLQSAHKAAVIEKIMAGDQTWKAITPFYDINLTLLGNWSTTNPQVADVTQEAIQPIFDPANNYYGTYSRGRLEAKEDGVVDLKVMAYAGNAGIIGGTPISNVTVSQIKQDEGIQITVDAKAEAEKFYGLIADIACSVTSNGITQACGNNRKKDSYVDLSAMTGIATPSQFDCLLTVPKGNNATPFYSCQDISANWTGFITFTLSVPNATTTVTLLYPDNSTNNFGKLELPSGLQNTSVNEYSIIINVNK